MLLFFIYLYVIIWRNIHVNNYDFNSRYCIKVFLSNGKKYCEYFNTVSSAVSNKTENLLNKTNTCA